MTCDPMLSRFCFTQQTPPPLDVDLDVDIVERIGYLLTACEALSQQQRLKKALNPRSKRGVHMSNQYSKEQKAAIYGPAATHAEYSEGDSITFVDPATGKEHSGDVLYAAAPTQAGKLQYFVDCGDGFPYVVQSGDIKAEVSHE